MMKGIKWGFRVLVYKQVWWLNSILNNKASTMMGHTIHSVLNHLKRYFKRNVNAFLICFTLGVYPYWLPATLLATILTKLIWRLLKMKFISSKLKSLCKRLMSQSLDEKVATIRNIRKVLIDTKFYEDNFLFKPTKQEAAFILIRLEQYAPALQLLSEVKGEENEDEGIQLIKALVNHLQDSKPLSDDAKITNHKLEELLDNIIQNKLKADAPKKYEKMPQRFIKNIFDSVSASRYTSNPPRTSKNNRVTSNDRININYDKYFFIPDQSLPYFFNLFGNRFDAPVVNIRGLTNLGNTCYMNSALQCLHKSFQLTSQIKQSQIPPSLFVRVYLQLMDNLSEDTATPFRPQKIKELIGKYNEIFADRAQHDAGELMSTVLSHLSEDLNTVTARKVYKIDASVTRNNDQLLEEYIKRDRYRSHSLIEQLFFGRFLTNYKCLDCNHQQRLFEKFSVLFLPMPARGETDLQACMRSFLVPDRMEGNNAWWCTNCGRETRTDKSMSVYQHSPFLAICLKRFDSNRKVTSLVRFDQQITLRFISHRPSVQQLRYQLYGVINHVGSSLDYGHYFSFCLDGNTWRKYDDERVTEISAQDLVTSNAFVLLYRLIK